MSTALIGLSNQIDAALPQLAMLAVGRKLAVATVWTALGLVSCSPLWHLKAVRKLRNFCRVVQRRASYVWASVYVLLCTYVVWDTASNVTNFVNCKAHGAARPVAIHCAVSLVCFVFTSKISTSVMSLITMFCAKDMNVLTGVAGIVNFAVWADCRGCSLTLFAVACLSGTHFAFCRARSSALLCVAGLAWDALWTWLAIVRSITTGQRTRNSQKDQ